MEFADRVATLTPEGAYHMLARAQALEAAGRSIIHLEIGQPDVPTFKHIADAGIQAIQSGQTRYTPSAGINSLRQLIAVQASSRLGASVDPAQVVVGPGAKPFLFFPTLALVSPGDEVIYPDPGFPTYAAMIAVAGGIPVPVPLRESNNFSYDMQAFEHLLSSRTRLVVINSPSNPTGGVVPQNDLDHIADLAVKHNFWVLSDEIYTRLTYNRPVPSIYRLPEMEDRTVICDGFSKTYAMTGWRLGFGIMPKSLAERVELLLTHSIGCTASFTQIAGMAAVKGDQSPVEAVVAEYRHRRDALVLGLNAIPGISCRSPEGAFYVFPNITGLGKSSEWLADFLLEEAGVAVLPGTSFGRNGEGYLRLCFANSIENIMEALERMRTSLARL